MPMVCPNCHQDIDPVRTPSRRELEVLRLVVLGQTNKTIGRALHIGDNTVRAHIRNLCDKLGCDNRVQLAVAGYKMGLGHDESKEN